jgi:GDP-4-dehydro-6-deoxy-D-mannose reductase
MANILVTGVNGFVGQHTVRTLAALQHPVVGVGNQGMPSDEIKDFLKIYHSCDLTNPEAVKNIDLSDIDAIINLAGLAKVGDSKGQGALYKRVNVGVHSVLYDECLRQGASPRIIAVSTGAVYDAKQPLPIAENSKLVAIDKTNEYVQSKIAMEESLDHYRNRGLHIIVARPFNHSGPGQLSGFLLPDLGEQIETSKNQGIPLKVGNLKTKRDYTDVRDVAKAYVSLATTPADQLKHTLYNICSGKSVEGTEILDILTSAFGASHITVEVDPSRIRPHEVMDIYGSHDSITEDTGWLPIISVEQMVQDYVAWKKTFS